MIKRIYIIFFVLILSFQSKTQTIVDSSRMVKVLSFNILHGATTRGDFDLDIIAKVIIESEADFVAMQEVDFKTKRAKNYDLATELGWRTKLISLFARAMPYDGGEYGEAILSRYTLLGSRKVDLPHSKGNEPRAALEITTTIASGDTISLIGTHFDHTKDNTDRLLQANKINQVFSKNNYPTILVGDLNAEPGSKTIKILEEIWKSSYDKKKTAYTYPSHQASKKIDYIMYYPKNKWRVLDRQAICDTIASDHCAYLVTLELL